jgi:hypothetical protein
MKDRWTLLDNSDGKSKGYLEIRCNSRRVADAFPYPGHADAAYSEWIRRKVQEIVDKMNAVK